MTDNEYSKTRKAAVDALIYWAKTGMREFTMRDAVNNYLEASGANRPSIGGEETILAHRKIAANRLAIDCIYALSKEELSKVDRVLKGICRGKALIFTNSETYKSSPFALLYSLS
ncbi:MAG: hypothetical protein PUD79_03275 [Prevotellaceae bacterium]|nr:hypothetical protein [Prevotellaceae bacterium]